jgi:integral membrane protein
MAGCAEAVSFLALLAIAMPLKYMAGWPYGVTVVGWIHGVLFVLFCAALARVWLVCRWPLMRAAVVFIAALVPFGPFLIDRWMRGWEAGMEAGGSGAGLTSSGVDPAQG